MNRESIGARRSITICSIVRDIFHQIYVWFRAGSSPPQSQRNSVLFLIFLNLVGLVALTIWLLAFFKIKFYATFTSIVPIAIVAAMMLIPGLYGTWLSWCCWRRRPGYSWDMLPRYN
jgi:hypothetical protein